MLWLLWWTKSRSCYCDYQCTAHFDCCDDYYTACILSSTTVKPPTPDGSCDGSCGSKGSGDCWCDLQCAANYDCCGDYLTYCS
uniref:Proteoglycan 4-like n=1 Tax=Saccoglossus kowalevskii TaxID=10224 RepID=A0ABM0MJC9_SACKO